MPDLPSPPFIDIPGVANFRGIGGAYVGPGLVYRAADPSQATKTGREKMSQDLGKVGRRGSVSRVSCRQTYTAV